MIDKSVITNLTTSYLNPMYLEDASTISKSRGQNGCPLVESTQELINFDKVAQDLTQRYGNISNLPSCDGIAFSDSELVLFEFKRTDSQMLRSYLGTSPSEAELDLYIQLLKKHHSEIKKSLRNKIYGSFTQLHAMLSDSYENISIPVTLILVLQLDVSPAMDYIGRPLATLEQYQDSLLKLCNISCKLTKSLFIDSVKVFSPEDFGVRISKMNTIDQFNRIIENTTRKSKESPEQSERLSCFFNT